MDTDTKSLDLPIAPAPNGGPSNVEQKDLDQLPKERPGDWHIEMHLPIADRGHAFLRLVDLSGDVQRELHGLARSRNTGQLVAMGRDGAHLVGVQSPGPYFDDPSQPARTIPITRVYSGDYDDVVRGKWRTGLQAAVDMNRKNLDYKGDDLSYEGGTNGGEIQNSNSANFSFGKPMHLDLSTAIRNKGLDRVFPGWGRDVFDPTYRPYVAPPMFPPNLAP
jgi:hypothetical protein